MRDNGKIYCLYYKGTPIYIGQTINTIENRYKNHKKSCYIKNQKKHLYDFIRSKVNIEDFEKFITIKCIKIVKIEEVLYWEQKAINYCLKRNINLFNISGNWSLNN